MSTGSLFTNEIQEIELALEITREMLQKKDQEHRERRETFGDHKLEQPIPAADRFGYKDEVDMLLQMLRAFRKLKLEYSRDLFNGYTEIQARAVASSARLNTLQIRENWNEERSEWLALVRNSDVDFDDREHAARTYMKKYHQNQDYNKR